ncbi:MAG: phospholipase [Gammaproteobacteria bacterium]|nr:phospholipase [Gammaproteobacteria bacterium]
MTAFAQGKIEAFCGPTELGAPDDLEQVVSDFIRGAKKTLDIAVQELDNEVIAQALLDAALKGVRIRMFMEQDYLCAASPPKPTPKAGQTVRDARLEVQWEETRRPKTLKTNRDILAALLRCGVDVKADLNPKIFHQKFIVRDYRGGRSLGRAGLLTGSTNFTTTGTHKNLNHVILFHDYRVARAYAAEFEELMGGTFGALRSREEILPKTINIKGVPVRVLFAPDDHPELEIIKQMLKARARLDFAIFTFAGSSGIDDALIMLHLAGIDIQGVLDAMQGGQDWAATHWLHDEGIEVFLSDRLKLPGLGKLHHKLMVIDDDIVIAGSMNYTAPANEYNDENIFVLGNPYDLSKSEGGPVDHLECKAIAAFFRNEIERIVAHSTRFEPS